MLCRIRQNKVIENTMKVLKSFVLKAGMLKGTNGEQLTHDSPEWLISPLQDQLILVMYMTPVDQKHPVLQSPMGWN